MQILAATDVSATISRQEGYKRVAAVRIVHQVVGINSVAIIAVLR